MIALGLTVARRPPVDAALLVRAPRGYLVGVGRGCGCASGGDVASVMGALGMVHAAAMHADPDRDWTAEDWRDHIREEREILFPALLEAGAGDPTVRGIVAQLEDDHDDYLARLAQGRDLPRGGEPRSVDAHGRIEDELVRQYIRELRALADEGSGARVGAPLTLSTDYAATLAPAKKSASPPHASSWWSLLVGGALGAGAWAVGLGPLGIALSAAGGAGGAYAVQRAAPAPPPRLLYSPPPLAIGDPEAYFREIAKQADELRAVAAARQDESDERVREWKEAAKKIPVIGDFSGALIDLGVWFGKALGSAYAEENAPEDLQHAADGIAAWLRVGLVPPQPNFTAKNGANSYGRELDRGLELLRIGADKSAADNLSAQAIQTMATLTIVYAGCPAVRQAIADAGSGNGSLRGVGWYAVPCAPGEPWCSKDGTQKLVGFETIVSAIASCAYGVPADRAFAYARRVTDHAGDYPIRPGLATHPYANAFTEVMRAASHGEIP